MGLFGNKRKNSNTFFTPAVNQKTLHRNLEFTAREQYKLLRTNLSFTLPEDEKCHIIGITSSMRGEGKSTTAVNLSYVLAESGNKVLLIDGDLRIPSVGRKMRIPNNPGLTDLLKNINELNYEDYDFEHCRNWHIIPSGDLPPNPSELLGSARMEKLLLNLKEKYDFIIIDLPPVNIVSDAAAISKFLSGIVVVIRENYAEKQELDTCMTQLQLSNVKILGCVINDAKGGKGYYGRNKYKKHYQRYYSTYGYTQGKA